MVGHIEIHGEIGTRVTFETVKAQINPSFTSYIVHLSSEGGDVYEGMKIYHSLKALPDVTVVVEGLAASIATLIMQAGKKIIALRPSDIMIHNPWGQKQGEADDFIAAAEQLNRIKSTLISIYKPRLKKSETEIAAMMDDETWMTADEAMAAGLVDEVQDRLKAVAKINFKQSSTMENKIEKMFNALMDKIEKALNPKNMIEAPLEDGTIVIIDTEDPADLEGKSITINGEKAPNGPHRLADGRVITVEDGVIVSVGGGDNGDSEVEAKKKEEDEYAALRKENEELKSQLAAIQAAKNEAEQNVKAANKKVNDLTVNFKAVKEEVEKLKNMTVGDDSVPGASPEAEMKRETTKQIDPAFAALSGHLTSYLEGRNFIKPKN